MFITLERPIPGIDASSVGGKFLARNVERLNQSAKELNVLPLDDMISVNPEEALAFLEGEGQDVSALSMPPEKWFTAEQGLKTVTTLLQHSERVKPGEPGLIADLKSCQQVLERAKQANIRFHFTVDF